MSIIGIVLLTKHCILSRNNFLKLDVYFASLQQEVVAQQKAYGPLNFLSKWHPSLFVASKNELRRLLEHFGDESWKVWRTIHKQIANT